MCRGKIMRDAFSSSARLRLRAKKASFLSDIELYSVVFLSFSLSLALCLWLSLSLALSFSIPVFRASAGAMSMKVSSADGVKVNNATNAKERNRNTCSVVFFVFCFRRLALPLDIPLSPFFALYILSS